MKNIIKKISNELLVYIKEDGLPLKMPEFSIHSKESHNPLFKKYIIGSGLFNSNFNPNDHMIFDLIKISQEQSFLVFCNTTNNNNNNKFDSVCIHATKELSDAQRLIANYCFNSFQENVKVNVIMYDKGNFPTEIPFEEYIYTVNEEKISGTKAEKVLVKK